MAKKVTKKKAKTPVKDKTSRIELRKYKVIYMNEFNEVTSEIIECHDVDCYVGALALVLNKEDSKFYTTTLKVFKNWITCELVGR